MFGDCCRSVEVDEDEGYETGMAVMGSSPARRLQKVCWRNLWVSSWIQWTLVLATRGIPVRCLCEEGWPGSHANTARLDDFTFVIPGELGFRLGRDTIALLAIGIRAVKHHIDQSAQLSGATSIWNAATLTRSFENVTVRKEMKQY